MCVCVFTHAFNRLWSLLRLRLSRLEDREKSSSHHTCIIMTLHHHRHHHHHHRHHHHRHPDVVAVVSLGGTLASSSCEAMKLSWLTFTRSEAVTTVTIRFSRRPTRFPMSSSSRSLVSCRTTRSDKSFGGGGTTKPAKQQSC